MLILGKNAPFGGVAPFDGETRYLISRLANSVAVAVFCIGIFLAILV